MNNSTKILLILALLSIVGLGGTMAYAMMSKPADNKLTAHAQAKDAKTDSKKASLENFFAAWRDGDKERANKQMSALLKLSPKDPHLKLINADFQRYYTGKPDDSIAILREMVSFQTDDPKPYAALARHLAELGEQGDPAALNEAQEQIATAIKRTEERGEEVPLHDWETQAWVLGLSGTIDQALDQYANRVFQQTAYTVDNPAFMLHYATLLEQGGHLKEAVEVYHDIRDLMVTQVDEQGRTDLEWAQTNARSALERLTDR